MQFSVNFDVHRSYSKKNMPDNHNQLQAILDTIVDGILTIDEKGKLEMLNPSAQRLFGYTSDEILGKNINVLMPEPYQGEHDQYLRTYIETGQAKIIGFGREVLGLKKNGSTFPIYLAVSETYLDERRIFTGIVRDLTEQKKAKEVVKQMNAALKVKAQELADANEEVKNFAYIVSHDLKAPLVNITGFSMELKSSIRDIDAALEEVPHDLRTKFKNTEDLIRADIQESLEFIESSVHRMDALISALLNLSRLGHRTLEFQPVDMNELLKNILASQNYEIARNKIKVLVNPLPEVIADSTSMEQIMGNLIDNAIKYIDPDRDCKIEITGNRLAEETIFQISDTGRGIAEHDIKKIFNIFRRAGKEDISGQGMGLAYVKMFIKRHQGSIHCESALKRGTTFKFSISNNLIEGDSHA